MIPPNDHAKPAAAASDIVICLQGQVVQPEISRYSLVKILEQAEKTPAGGASLPVVESRVQLQRPDDDQQRHPGRVRKQQCSSKLEQRGIEVVPMTTVGQ